MIHALRTIVALIVLVSSAPPAAAQVEPGIVGMWQLDGRACHFGGRAAPQARGLR